MMNRAAKGLVLSSRRFLSSNAVRSKTSSSSHTSTTAAIALATTTALLISNNNDDEVAITQQRPAISIATCEASSPPTPKPQENEATKYQKILSKHTTKLKYYKQKWDWLNNPTSRLPTIAWPSTFPPPEDIPALLADTKYCRRSPNYRNDGSYCDSLRFRVASYYIFMGQEEEEHVTGLRLLRDLAERGHADGMCAYGICLNDGRGGNDPNPKQAVAWWRQCVDMHDHVQSAYELGVALYTGEGVVEDEVAAVEMFERAANKGHSGAAYILGDCLLDGVGTEMDRGEALEWLVKAAELGHRGARSRVLAVLEKKEGEDYGRFTDASRQTLVKDVDSHHYDDDDVEPIEEEEKDVDVKMLPIERRYTIGGGSGNPVILARRRTIIQESRDE